MINELALAKKLAEGAEAATPKPLRQALLNILDPFTKEVGLIMALPFHWWRFRASLAILEKAKAVLQRRHATPEPVPLKVLISVLDHGALEEDDNMIDRWASLLASAADPTHSGSFLPSFAHILNELSPKEAQLLDLAYARAFRRLKGNSLLETVCLPSDEFRGELGLTDARLAVVLENLHRLRLIELSANPRYAWPPGGLIGPPHSQFYFTRLGGAFVEACSSKTERETPRDPTRLSARPKARKSRET